MNISIFEEFIFNFHKMMVVAQKEEVLLLIDNFLGHKVPNLGA